MGAPSSIIVPALAASDSACGSAGPDGARYNRLMPNEQVDRLAEKLIHEVRDETLDEAWHYFYPTSPPGTTGHAIHRDLVAGLDAARKDLLWNLLTEMVEQTVHKVLMFVDHKRVVGELRVLLCDPETGRQSDPLSVTGVESIDLGIEYWTRWLEEYPRTRERPKTSWLRSHEDDLPPAVRSAAAREFGGRTICDVDRHVDDDLRTLAYRVTVEGEGAGPVAAEYLEDGSRR